MHRFKFIIKSIVVVSIILLLTVLASVPYALYSPQSPIVNGVTADRILLHNINILSADFKSLLPHHTVVIEDGIITKLPESTPADDDFDIVIDGHGRYLMPGLTDVHTHIYDRSDLLLNLAHGVTQVRVMHGLKLQLALKKEIQSGITIGPDMLVASPAINQRSQYAASEFHTFIESESEGHQLVKNYSEAGYDLIKIYDGLSQDNFKAISKAAQQFDIPFAGHSPFAVPLDQLLASNIQSIEHIEMLYQAALNYSRDQSDLDALIQALEQNPKPISTTLIVYDELAQAAEMKSEYIESKPMEYIPDVIQSIFSSGIEHIMQEKNPQSWRSKADYLGFMAKQLYAAEIPMLLGSDAGANYTINGIGAIREMQLLEGYGVPTESILVSATVNPANAFGLNNSGQVAEGFKANLIITDTDPRTDLSTFYELNGLIKDGIYYDKQAIVQMKVKAKEHMPSYEFLGWYLINWWQS
ncbi:MAG: amidohydrolase family protein [Kangiella sp.]|nr:amidohydrolase family protein [Kangiella sp.]